MSRVQLALSVSDLEASITFYSRLFGTEPHKQRPGYANFAITEPALKLVLIEVPGADRGHGPAGALNHLGVEVDSTDEVTAAADRLATAGLATFEEAGTTCCHATQDKVWVHDPAGAPWEIYTITDDDPVATAAAGSASENGSNDGACCTPASGFAAASPTAMPIEQAACC